MPIVHALVQCPVRDSFRVRQLAGMFDLPVQDQGNSFSVEVPDVKEDWKIGLIVGPSGSGKTTIARTAFGDALWPSTDWPHDAAIIDGLGEKPIQAITQALTSVGFSSPPAWLRPYRVLSNGERFRCDLARALLSDRQLVVFDEFTSVVDRTVAKVGSAAVSKAIRSGRIGKQFVAVSCHYDIADWLEPDWVLDMGDGSLSRRRLRRPDIRLHVVRCDRSAWKLFKRHHYLNAELHRSAQCFVGLIDDRPAVFTAVLHFPHPVRSSWREHRTVCAADFQGLGIGSAMSEFVAGMYAATGKPYTSVSSHPAIVHHRCRNRNWKMTRPPSRVNRHCGDALAHLSLSRSGQRMTASFEYVGPPRMEDARRLGVVKCGMGVPPMRLGSTGGPPVAFVFASGADHAK